MLVVVVLYVGLHVLLLVICSIFSLGGTYCHQFPKIPNVWQTFGDQFQGFK